MITTTTIWAGNKQGAWTYEEDLLFDGVAEVVWPELGTDRGEA